MVISMLKIRRPLGRLIFNMGIAIPGKTVFLIETAPWSFVSFALNHQYDIALILPRTENGICTQQRRPMNTPMGELYAENIAIILGENWPSYNRNSL